MKNTILLAVKNGLVVLSVNGIELHITPKMARRLSEKFPEAAEAAERQTTNRADAGSWSRSATEPLVPGGKPAMVQ